MMIRVQKRETPYVMIDKTGLQDTRLSWKAKGLLCYLLSLPDDWQIYQAELTSHSKDGLDSTRAGIQELMKYGYIERVRDRNEKGQLTEYIYQVYETPIRAKTEQEVNYKPKWENPTQENPTLEKPKLLKNKAKEKINRQNNLSIDQTERSDYEAYKQIISENIEYDALKQQNPGDEILDDLLNVMVDTVSSSAKTILVGKENKPSDIVKSIFLKINQGHIEYVLEKIHTYPDPIKNPKSFAVSCLYNAYCSSAIGSRPVRGYR